MRHRNILFAIALVAVATISFASRHIEASASAPDPANTIIVKFNTSANDAAISALNKAQAADQVDAIPALGLRVLHIPSGKSAATVVAAYAHNPLVQWAEPNLTAKALDTIPNDAAFGVSQWGLTKIQAPAAWDITTGSAAIVIAVVDTGVFAGHPDLTGKVLAGYNFVAGTSDASDDNGHGTWVSGIVAANTNNAAGMSGVSWGSPILPVKVCDGAGSCSYANIANGIAWAADHGAKVINLSVGGTTACSNALQSAVDYAWGKGLVIVAASGNESASTVDTPGNCNHVVAVGATDSTDARASWSNYGTALGLVAPGATITCTTLAGGLASCSGTSFASPRR